MPASGAEHYSELELRGTLVALADRDEPDLDAFRTRMIVAESAAPRRSRVDSSSDVIDIDPSYALIDVRSRRRSRFLTAKALAVAAGIVVVLLVAGVALGLSLGNAPHRPNNPAASVPEPEPQLPGSVILQRYGGVGPSLISIPRYRVAAHETLAIYAGCKGSGSLRISPGGLTPSCSNVFGDSFPTSIRTLRVTVRPTTIWRITLVREPTLRTNGSVQTPVDPEFAHPDRFELGRGNGDGNGVVNLKSAPGKIPHAQIILTCHGSGVALSGGSSSLFRTLYTHTCFPGSEYIFDVTKYAVPRILNVSAKPGTTWQLFVRPN